MRDDLSPTQIIETIYQEWMTEDKLASIPTRTELEKIVTALAAGMAHLAKDYYNLQKEVEELKSGTKNKSTGWRPPVQYKQSMGPVTHPSFEISVDPKNGRGTTRFKNLGLMKFLMPAPNTLPRYSNIKLSIRQTQITWGAVIEFSDANGKKREIDPSTLTEIMWDSPQNGPTMFGLTDNSSMVIVVKGNVGWEIKEYMEAEINRFNKRQRAI